MEPVGSLFLGIDGGQSSTIALIGDETGRVIGSGSGAPCNQIGAADERAKFRAAIEECVDAACRQASLDSRETRFQSACLGLSGLADGARPALNGIVRADRIVISNDAVIALSGATVGEPGVITIAGSGSISFGRNRAGKTARAGGWGYVFGDEAGAFGIARQGLRAALRQEEGWGPATKLHGLFLEAGGARSANQLMHMFYSPEFSRARIASFSALVERAASEGDRVARGILLKAAAELALLASAVRRQLFERGETVRVAHMGGVFRSAIVREQFCALVQQEPGNHCGPPVYAPAAGALIEAYRAAGLNPPLTNVPDVKR
jgi:N-acetylglucosamine kinase-like BadF-type ATPase